jgi:hypothetical protein
MGANRVRTGGSSSPVPAGASLLAGVPLDDSYGSPAYAETKVGQWRSSASCAAPGGAFVVKLVQPTFKHSDCVISSTRPVGSGPSWSSNGPTASTTLPVLRTLDAHQEVLLRCLWRAAAPPQALLVPHRRARAAPRLHSPHCCTLPPPAPQEEGPPGAQHPCYSTLDQETGLRECSRWCSAAHRCRCATLF